MYIDEVACGMVSSQSHLQLHSHQHSPTHLPLLQPLPSPFLQDIKHNLPRLLSHASSKPQRFLQSLHALTVTLGLYFFDQPIFITNNLISAYASFGQLPPAQRLFDKMPERNAVSYNSIISAHAQHEHQHGGYCWTLFTKMMSSGLRPTQFTFGSLLSSSSLDIFQGLQLHSMIFKIGLLDSHEAFSGTALIGLFGRLGSLGLAKRLFDEMPQKNLVTWNSMISSFGRKGCVQECTDFFRDLLRTGNHPSESSFVGVLSGFAELPDFEACEQIHAMVIKTGSELYSSVLNSLINVYAKCSVTGTLVAEKVFHEMPIHDTVSWNTIIGALARNGKLEEALELFLSMPRHGFMPNEVTFSIVISVCASLQNSKYGQLVHAKVLKNSLQSDIFVGSALVDFYAKCSDMDQAHLLFDELEEKNEVAWNALIAGYSVKNSCFSSYLLQQMLRMGYQPNEFTFSVILKSASVKELQQLHCLIVLTGYSEDHYVSSSLIASYIHNGLIFDALKFAPMGLTPSLPTASFNVIAGIYSRNGQYQETKRLISYLEHQDNVSSNILISACAHNGDYREAFERFKDMQLAGALPDNYTAMSLLSISTRLCNLGLGSAIHGLLVKVDFKLCDTFVRNALVDMYAKCGSIHSSMKVFNEMTNRNLISWTTLISGLGLHGYASFALDKFREMESLGLKPDTVSFMSVLSACRHGGLVEHGMELFNRMKWVYGIEPEMEHYVCIVNLLARRGYLKEAEGLISSMPYQPNALIWRTFLEGCRRYPDLEKQAGDEGRGS